MQHTIDSGFLEDAGLGDVRPDVGTYGRYDFDQLPRLPFEMRGDLAWLAAAPPHKQHIGVENASEVTKAIPLLRKSAARLGLRLPEEFTRFMEQSRCKYWIRSTHSLTKVTQRSPHFQMRRLSR